MHAATYMRSGALMRQLRSLCDSGVLCAATVLAVVPSENNGAKNRQHGAEHGRENGHHGAEHGRHVQGELLKN